MTSDPLDNLWGKYQRQLKSRKAKGEGPFEQQLRERERERRLKKLDRRLLQMPADMKKWEERERLRRKKHGDLMRELKLGDFHQRTRNQGKKPGIRRVKVQPFGPINE